MINKTRLREAVLGEIGKRHKLGEHAGGSGHLGYVHLTNLDMGEPVEIEYNEKLAYEIHFTFETYTESEFHYASDDTDSNDIYSNTCRAKIVVDEALRILDYQKLE